MSDADSLLEGWPETLKRWPGRVLYVRGKPEPIFQWVVGRVLNLVAAWLWNRGTIRHLSFVGEERFRKAFANLERDIAALMDLINHFANQEEAQWSKEQIADLAEHLENSAHAFALEVAGQERAGSTRERKLNLDGVHDRAASVDEMAMAYLRNQALEVAGAGLAIRTAMTVNPSAPKRGPLTGAERVRRMRERERRGLRFMVPVSVYDGDLNLLRAFGFLAGHEMGDRGAVARALEAFLATGYLEHSAVKPDLEDRLEAQVARRSDLTRAGTEC